MSGGMFSTTRQLRTGYVLSIVVAGSLAYCSSFGGVFVDQDDFGSIRFNEYIRSLRKPWRAMALPPYELGEGATAAGRPALGLSFAINYAISGLNPRGFHWGNLMIHLGVGLCLFGIVRRTLRQARAGGYSEHEASGRAAAVALLWVVHPLNTQAVTYLVQRAESQAGLLYLLTLYCALRAWESRHPWRWEVCAGLACLVGMCTKQTVATAPVLVWAYDALVCTGSWRAAWRQRWRLYVMLVASWLPLMALHVWVLSRHIITDLSLASPWRYALMQPGVMLHYLELALWPDRLVFQHHWPLRPVLAELPAVLIIGAALVLTGWGAVRNRMWAFPGVWFFLMLAPSSSFYPQHAYNAVNEHRMYLALAAVVTVCVMAGACVLERLMPRKSTRRLAGVVLTSMVAGVLGWRTYLRNFDYHDMVTLYTTSAARQPGNATVRRRIGDIYLERGDAEAALMWYDRALEIAPDGALIYLHRGQALRALQRNAEALSNYLTAIEHCPQADEFYVEAGLEKYRQGDLAGAMKLWKEVLQRNSNYGIAHVHLSRAYAEMGEMRRSEEHARRAQACAAQMLQRMKPEHHYPR